MHYQDLCELLERTRDEDFDRHCDNLEQHLDAAPLEEVEGFHRCLIATFDWLDVPPLRTAAALILGGVTEQSFAAFRGRLLLAGKEAFESAAADPEALVEFQGAWTCERVLKLAAEVYERRNGEPLGAWTLDRLSIERPDDLPDGYLEEFREHHPRFWAHFPWELGPQGLARERRTVIPASARRRLTGWRNIAVVAMGLSLFAAQALAMTGHWWIALAAVVALALEAFYWLYQAGGYLQEVFVETQRSARIDGELEGTVRYRLIRLTPPASRGESYRTELTEGLRIIEREAERYGKEVHFVEDGPPLFLGCRHPESLRRAIGDARPKIEQVRDELREGEGPSFVVVVADAGDEAYANYALRAACISTGWGKGTYAHEVLHLFGACDLYESDGLDQFRAQAVRRTAEALFSSDFDPDVVSLMDESSHEEARVDPFTARLLGWA